MTRFNMSHGETIPFSDMAAQFGLTANVELTYTVPGVITDSYRANFSFPEDANVWVSLNRTATTPTVGTMSPDARCELNPDFRYVHGTDVIHFKSSAQVNDAGVSLLQLPS